MATRQAVSLGVLYQQDETAWLEAMAQLAAQRRHSEMDCLHLGECLSDMAKRDRREVFSRLVVLMNHLLKWHDQAESRSGSWRGTIREQLQELRHLFESGTLRNHAEARLRASDETECGIEMFPMECA